ncbi:FkbM family methyltransferase [Flavobacterium yafengii]|uniref:FkbM family methyltransferase n=1 Tax=Flavobacterium yafengii TaxID=3041253 RepID=A0AAW6TQG7_9FLAO|nr:FkbM family methyltransferase [Flavobacterium yafengii]MDI5950701.1 FkbM family methyltransferase [Flavobacterium yafengii]
MKKIIYDLINKLGYRIENKRKIEQAEMIFLNKFNIKGNLDLFFNCRKYILKLNEKFKNLTLVAHKDGFFVSFLDLVIYVESADEFFILTEVFVENEYNFITNSKSIVIDIGANIGVSSLFFSKLNYVEKIYAFEPVKGTFEQAQYNLSLNNKIHKVEWIKNIGLGKEDYRDTFKYNKDSKGKVGVRSKLSSNSEKAVETEVQICDASIEISKILNDIKDKKIILKIDCEGAEYEIFDNIYKSGVINQVDVILLEWHDRGSQLIEKILLDSGFEIISKNICPISGIVYAFKKP